MIRFVICCALVGCVLALSERNHNVAGDVHNRYRSDLALGKIDNSDGVKLPTGRNIYELKTDHNLEYAAEEWAKECRFEHSPLTQRNNSGQNLYYTTALLDNEKLLQEAAAAWWNELSNYGVHEDLKFTVTEFNRGIGHWSQMAWGRTTKIGCGINYCDQQGYYIVVCNYAPAGNILGQSIYERGDPCRVDEQCTAYDRSVCDSNTSLCSI